MIRGDKINTIGIPRQGRVVDREMVNPDLAGLPYNDRPHRIIGRRNA